MASTESLREAYRRFAAVECGDYAPHYARLSLAVAADPEILRFIGDQPEPQPNLFFASVQYLSGVDAMPADGGELRAFVSVNEGDIATLMRSRRTQTNEVGRCAALLPALPSGPLALLEVGSSAGLCLLMDRYRYRYGSRTVGDPASSVVVDCRVAGPVPIPSRAPEIEWRRGLDLRPVDVMDDDAARWLLACVWSDHAERRSRLEAAIQVARRDPPVVVQGDLVDGLKGLIAEAPPSASLVIFHSAVLSYVSEEQRRMFAELVTEASRGRPIVWISFEGPGVIASLESHAPERGRMMARLGRSVCVDGLNEHQLLALAHFHGQDLEWLA